MKYLIVALINAIYGILLLFTLTKTTPGLILIVLVASILVILGLIGFALWLWRLYSEKSPQSETGLKNWYQITRGVDILLVLGLLFRVFILQPFVVEGNSMENNFSNQEFLLVDRISYRFIAPHRGDVIIFRFPKNPSEDYIKRIIGLPGETVKIENGQIFINDLLLEEGYLTQDTLTLTSTDSGSFFEKTLSQDEYLVLGDNRENSSDSRDWGTVPKKNIIGRARIIVYPFDKAGIIKKPVINLENSFL